MGYAYKDYYKKKRAENKKLILEEDEYIMQNLYRIKARDIGYALGRTELSINIRVRTLRKNGKIDFCRTDRIKEKEGR